MKKTLLGNHPFLWKGCKVTPGWAIVAMWFWSRLWVLLQTKKCLFHLEHLSEFAPMQLHQLWIKTNIGDIGSKLKSVLVMLTYVATK